MAEPHSWHALGVSYDPTIYRGAAAHYVVGRPPYSDQLERVLSDTLGLDGTGRLLDVGCGPGVLALRLAPLFREVVAVDPDIDMLEEAKRRVTVMSGRNFTWVQGLAEELPALAPGPYRLVTFGQSFHRTDELAVSEAVFDMLEPGGTLALIVHTVDGRTSPPAPTEPPIPHEEIEAIITRFLGPRRRSGQGFAAVRTHRFEDILAQTRFSQPTTVFARGKTDLLRDVESVLSGYLSMTFAAPHLFGDRLADFEGEVRALLRSRSISGWFWDWPGDTEIVLARRSD
jgi:SAM-dependent methyltransferase